MKKYLFFILVLLALTSVKCSKQSQEDQLPPITTTGANTFGCKVNGKVWLPYGSFSVHALDVNCYVGNKINNPTLTITGSNRKNGNLSDIGIDVINLISDTSTYKIYNRLNEGLLYSDNNQAYEPFDTFGIVKIIKLDTIAKIISGTFSFIGYTDHTHSKQVNVTDGRFDLHYPTTIH
jgi:hypothetical protein